MAIRARETENIRLDNFLHLPKSLSRVVKDLLRFFMVLFYFFHTIATRQIAQYEPNNYKF